MGQKHKRFWEFGTPFPLRDIRENPRSNVRARAAGDGAICSKNRKIVPYHGANPDTRNGALLRSPSLIMAPAVNRQMAKQFTANRQKRSIFTVNRQMREPKLAGFLSFVKNDTLARPKRSDLYTIC